MLFVLTRGRRDGTQSTEQLGIARLTVQTLGMVCERVAMFDHACDGYCRATRPGGGQQLRIAHCRDCAYMQGPVRRGRMRS